MMPIRLVFALAVLTLASTPADAQWTVERDTDSMTDAIIATALVRNDAGFKLSVRPMQDTHQVYASFRLPDNAEVLDTERPAMYRVDKNDPQELVVNPAGTDDLLGFKQVIVEPKWVQFLVWHGEGETVLSTPV